MKNRIEKMIHEYTFISGERHFLNPKLLLKFFIVKDLST